MKNVPVAEVKPCAPVADPKEPVKYLRRYVEERWEIHLNNVEDVPSTDIIEDAKVLGVRMIDPRSYRFKTTIEWSIPPIHP